MNETSLQKITQARQWLLEAKNLDDVKHIIDIAEAARVYSRAAKLGLEAQNEAAEIKLRAERMAGEMLGQLKRGGGGDRKSEQIKNTSVGNLISEYREVLDEQEIPNTTAHRWQSLSKLPDQSFENYIHEKQDKMEEITTAGALRLVSSHHVSDDTYEWFTPKEYIEAARDVMGSIDIDPASCDTAQEVVKAKKYYTIETDGLSEVWSGNVWINPPYSLPEIELFIKKVKNEYESGSVKQAVILTNNSSDTRWFQSLGIYPFCLTLGRLKFWNSEGKTLLTRQGQAIFYLGDNKDKFSDVFSKFGLVVKKYDH